MSLEVRSSPLEQAPAIARSGPRSSTVCVYRIVSIERNNTMVLTKTKIIDGRDHLLGRLASIVAKELLAGQSIVIVRCDEMVISGSCEFAGSFLLSMDFDVRLHSF